VSTRAAQFTAVVESREQLSEHLVRLVLGGDGLAGFTSTGIPDEWVGLVVPGQFQSRYYTVRSWQDGRLTLDVMVHDVGLVTEWVARGCVGDQVVVTEPKGAFTMPDDARWLLLVGDLTALPAIARISEWHLARGGDRSVAIHAEVPDDLSSYLPAAVQTRTTWLTPPAPGSSDLASVVKALDWPEGDGYFWMGGESAQMRAIRTHLMRERGLPGSAYHVMGYWRSVLRRQPRAVDPGPIWRAGKAAGKSDEQIWADYDAAREGESS
jgi:NADPH-dependent ferric siderophore reductase